MALANWVMGIFAGAFVVKHLLISHKANPCSKNRVARCPLDIAATMGDDTPLTMMKHG